VAFVYLAFALQVNLGLSWDLASLKPEGDVPDRYMESLDTWTGYRIVAS
jgi:hypothetical protein